MRRTKRKFGKRQRLIAASIAWVVMVGSAGANGVVSMVQLGEFGPEIWTDPGGGGSIQVTARWYEGCLDDPFAMTWAYEVLNIDYNPENPFGPVPANGLSGFQLQFPTVVPEAYNQGGPGIDGPWDLNTYSGIPFPDNGAEWDAPDGAGIQPGEVGIFFFCTGERMAEDANDGWAHSWLTFDGTVTQSGTFGGLNKGPGALFIDVGLACSAGDEICKKVKYLDLDGDGIVETGEEVYFRNVIHVQIPGSGWTDAEVKDNFGAQLKMLSLWATQEDGNFDFTLKGKSEKLSMLWTIGDDAEESYLQKAVMDLMTDLDPGGYQSYTECGLHEFNSGAVLKFRDEFNKKHSYETGSVIVPVFTPDMLGDCDGDGLTDAEEIAGGSDPFDPSDPSGLECPCWTMALLDSLPYPQPGDSTWCRIDFGDGGEDRWQIDPDGDDVTVVSTLERNGPDQRPSCNLLSRVNGVVTSDFQFVDDLSLWSVCEAQVAESGADRGFSCFLP